MVQCGGALEAKFRCAKVVAQNFLLCVCKYVLTHVLNYLCIHMYVLMYIYIQSTKSINTTRHLKGIWKNKINLRLKIVENYNKKLGYSEALVTFTAAFLTA